jgi:pimeloyl-ACP methyl ester carboxylesterase
MKSKTMQKNTGRRSYMLTATILLALMAPYFYFDSEKLVLNDQTRSSLAGQYVTLQNGVVHYELAGRPEAQVAVLVHGFSVPYYIWDNNFEALVKAGLRVLRYDLYGRGFSDRPEVVYNLDLFVDQLDQLLSGLNINQPVDLVGLSIGAPVVAAFANRYSQRIHSLTLIDPEVTRPAAKDIFPLNVPVLGEYLMGVYLAPVRLPKGQSDDFYRPERFPDWEAKYRIQMQYRGFRRALLSTIRHMILETDPLSEYKGVGKQDFPVLLLWGREDRTISSADIELVQRAIPAAQFYPIDQAGHIPQYERPEIVNPILIGFIEQR